MSRLALTVAIPTYRREAVLVDTLRSLLAMEPRAAEILVLDQTATHEPETSHALQAMADAGDIGWVRLTLPSIPAAMNQGLLRAACPLVLFLDDDIAPEAGLLAAHVQAHAAHPQGIIVAGRVIQPWEEDVAVANGDPFRFASTQPRWIHEFMGGNFSVPRAIALELGGFDENFVKVAYRFEAEFAHRFKACGRQIRFEPAACLHHLKVTAGGTRTFGDHLSTWRPDHAVGAYYFALRTGTWRDFATRPLRSVTTRYHLRHPWRIVGTLFAELSAMAWAAALTLRGPKRLPDAATRTGP
ncbi:glycosyltransferase family 2 protein [Caenimonas sp. SL110]|uniref:glycosyltransferase family 2 protein n=1 Tax=Caenimonas sp. SL110 TaxID=1450524 RepID=UPI00069F7241|nr:glycosyltransferase [Caenimonas sp. SL110]